MLRVGKKVSSKLSDCFPCFQTCVWPFIFVLEEDFNNIFSLNSSERLLYDFKGLDVQICVMV